MMNYEEQYGTLLEAIANEADAMAMAYFRAVGMRVARKLDGTAITAADGAIEGMARAAGTARRPALGQRWWAYRGEGAYRNGQKIQVSTVARLDEAMVFTTGTGPSKGKEAREKIRRLPDAARNGRALGGFWQHMLVAEGAIDAALDWTSKPWDLAPLGIIVEEAGGRSTNVRGEKTIYTGDFLSTNETLTH